MQAVVPARRCPLPVVLLGGLVGGLAWGAFARAWMRFISTDPEFTWSGTLFIVGGFGVAGLTQSVAYLGRRAEIQRRWLTPLRAIGVIGLFPLGLAAGGPLFPTILVTPLVLSDRGWPRWVRAVAVVVAAAPMVLIGGTLFAELGVGRAVMGAAWMVVIYAGIVWAAGFSLAPQRDGWVPPRAARLLGVVGLVLSVLFLVVIVVGSGP